MGVVINCIIISNSNWLLAYDNIILITTNSILDAKALLCLHVEGPTLVASVVMNHSANHRQDTTKTNIIQNLGKNMKLVLMHCWF